MQPLATATRTNSSSSRSRGHANGSHRAPITPTAAALDAVTGATRSGSSSSSSHAQQLAAALTAIVEGLRRNKLDRGSSRKELLKAAKDALASVEQLLAGT